MFFRHVLQRLAQGWAHVRYAATTLYLIRFPLLIGVLGAVVLLTPQGKDILRALAESHHLADVLIFVAATQLCGLIIWHVARTLFRFYMRLHPHHSLPHHRINLGLIAWSPRLLAAAVPGMVLLAAASAIDVTLTRGNYAALLLWLLAAATLFNLLATWLRRYYVRWLRLPRFIGNTLSVKEELKEQGQHTIQGLATGAKRFYRVMVVLSPLSILWITLSRGILPAWMNAGTITMLALGLATIFGSTLTYLAMRTRLPLFALTLLAAVVFSALGLNQHHCIRLLPASGNATGNRNQQCEYPQTANQVQPAYVVEQSGMVADAPHDVWQQTWAQRFGDRSMAGEPVIFVSASGGGIRAAYWTAYALSRLAERTPQFNQRLFSISAVSGGSVGAAVYSAVQHHAAQHPAATDYSERARRILGRDLLTPILSSFLFPDIAQRFIPFKLFPYDRAAHGELALEQYWYHAYPQLDSSLGAANNPLMRSLHEVAPWPAGPVPYLLLNSTDLPTGQRVVAHNLPHGISPIFAFAEPDVEYARILRLSTAAMLSARFPYVTPSGVINFTGGGGARQLRLGDGGYFENSGALSSLEVLERLHQHRQEQGRPFIPVVIQIDNDPGLTFNLDQQPPQKIASRPALGQVLDPINGLVNARAAHGYRASEQLRQWTTNVGASRTSEGLCDSSATMAPNARGHYFHLRLYPDFQNDNTSSSPANAMPLGWLLSDQAQEEIERQYNDRRNQCEVERLLQVLSAHR